MERLAPRQRHREYRQFPALFVPRRPRGCLYRRHLPRGSQPEVGPNLVVNGDFESDLSGPWNVSTNNAGSTISTSVSHSGSGSLHLVSTVAGSSVTFRSIWQ